jgi:arylsulfatase A-like enzyme
MTGKYAHVSGAVGLAHMGWPLAQEEKTVIDYFNEDGYETVHSGYIHERHPRMNRYQIDLCEHWDDFDSAVAVDKAIGYLEGRDPGDRPFYLNIGTMEVHASLWEKKLDVYGGPIPEEEVYVPNYVPDTPRFRRRFARFHASIGYLDTHFRRLVDAIDRLGYGSDTVVIFTTDHGIANMRSKGTLYDRGVEITLLVRLPEGKGAGTVREELIPNIDFAATVLDIAGMETPADMNGRSFWPRLTDGEYEPHGMIFTERNFHGERPYRGADHYIDRYDPIRSVRTRDFHYIRWFRPEIKKRPWLWFEVPEERDDEGRIPEPRLERREEELYHVVHDPGEFRNVATQPEYRDVKEDLRGALTRWMEETDDHVLEGRVPERPQEPGWGPWDDLD